LLIGDLTLRSVCRKVSVEVDEGSLAGSGPTEPPGVFKGRAMVDRREFDLRWNQDLDSGGLVVSDNITIDVELAVARLSSGVALPSALRLG
jgi:polyisoprenoid-binding protein YceI